MAKSSNFSEIEGKVPLKPIFQLTGNENMFAQLEKVPLIPMGMRT